MAMTDASAGTRGISAFLVSAEDAGLRVGAPEDKMGLRASKTAAIFLEDVRVGPERRLGAEGEGFKIAMTTLDHSRIGIAAQGIGIGAGGLRGLASSTPGPARPSAASSPSTRRSRSRSPT